MVESASIGSTEDVIHHARWTRSLVSSLLHRGGSESEDKVVHVMRQAIQVVTSDLGQMAFPADEVQWLVSTAWNQGASKIKY